MQSISNQHRMSHLDHMHVYGCGGVRSPYIRPVTWHQAMVAVEAERVGAGDSEGVVIAGTEGRKNIASGQKEDNVRSGAPVKLKVGRSRGVLGQ